MPGWLKATQSATNHHIPVDNIKELADKTLELAERAVKLGAFYTLSRTLDKMSNFER